MERALSQASLDAPGVFDAVGLGGGPRREGADGPGPDFRADNREQFECRPRFRCRAVVLLRYILDVAEFVMMK